MNMYYLGIDIGSVSTDAVLVNEKKEIMSSVVVPSGFDHRKAIGTAVNDLCHRAGIDKAEIKNTVSTGYGRRNVDFADKTVTEISCHAMGVYTANPSIRFVIDIGGQDMKVIKVGEKGLVGNFVMNDKCAAGTGRFLDVMAHALGIPVNELGQLSKKARKSRQISSTCTVFAESEVISLIAEGIPPEEIIAGIHESVAERVVSMAASLGIESGIAMTGGVAMNSGVVSAVEKRLGQIYIPAKPQIAGAYGASVYAVNTNVRQTAGV